MASTTPQNNARELTSQLWAMANDLRAKMDASEYRDYILGFIFYRYLSKRQERNLASSAPLDFTDSEISSNPQDVNNAYARQVAQDGIEDWREELASEQDTLSIPSTRGRQSSIKYTTKLSVPRTIRTCSPNSRPTHC